MQQLHPSRTIAQSRGRAENGIAAPQNKTFERQSKSLETAVTRFILPFLVAATVAAPAFAEAPTTEIHFTRDGTEFAATISERDGAQQIDGREVATGRHFVLRVVGSHVSGIFAGVPVSYNLSDVSHDSVRGAQLSAR